LKLPARDSLGQRKNLIVRASSLLYLWFKLWFENVVLYKRKYRNIPSLWNLKAKRLVSSIRREVVIEPPTQLPRIVSYNIVFPGIIALFTAEDAYAYLLF
jgi:hypothetical protein